MAASAWQRFRYLTLPLLMPMLLVATMLRLMDLLKVIDIVYVMTGGGPGHASRTINLYNYLVALSYDKVGSRRGGGTGAVRHRAAGRHSASFG